MPKHSPTLIRLGLEGGWEDSGHQAPRSPAFRQLGSTLQVKPMPRTGDVIGLHRRGSQGKARGKEGS